MLHCQEIVIDTKYLHCFSLVHSWFAGIFSIYYNLRILLGAQLFSATVSLETYIWRKEKKVGQDGGFEESTLKKTNISLLLTDPV